MGRKGGKRRKKTKEAVKMSSTLQRQRKKKEHRNSPEQQTHISPEPMRRFRSIEEVVSGRADEDGVL